MTKSWSRKTSKAVKKIRWAIRGIWSANDGNSGCCNSYNVPFRLFPQTTQNNNSHHHRGNATSWARLTLSNWTLQAALPDMDDSHLTKGKTRDYYRETCQHQTVRRQQTLHASKACSQLPCYPTFRFDLWLVSPVFRVAVPGLELNYSYI